MRSRTGHTKGALRGRWLLLAAVGILALIAVPAPAAAKPRPDFKVLSVKISNPSVGEPLHMFHHTNNSLQVHVKVKNAGDTAGRGQGEVKVQGDGELSPTRESFGVPKLRPGKSRVVDVELTGSHTHGINDYRTKACAHAKGDAKAGNDCRGGPNFAVIPFKWTGTTHSVVDDNGIVSTCDGNPTFTYNHPASGNSRFIYRATGSVSCVASGMQAGCTYSGGGEDISIEQFLTVLQVYSSLNTYNGVGASSQTYEALKECTPDPPEVVDLDVTAWLTTGDFSMDSSDTTLSGSKPINGDTWSWNLTAD